MRRFSTLFFAVCMSILITTTSASTSFAFAHVRDDAQQSQDKPDAASERKAYDALTACNNEQDNTKKLAMAKDALGLYPKSQYVPYFKDQILKARGGIVLKAISENKAEEAFKVADEALAEDPENMFFLLQLSDFTSRLIVSGNFTFAEKGSDYTKKLIDVINKGKIPAGIEEAKWKEGNPARLAVLHRTLGLIAGQAKKFDEAMASFTESLKFNCSDPLTYYYVSLIHNTTYNTLSDEYKALPDEDKTGDKGKAVLEKINGVVDQILEDYGKLMAFSEGNAGFDKLRNNIKPSMDELYKFRHEGKLDGLDAYISGLKANGCNKTN